MDKTAIATILATMLGGILAIIGGFIATYSTQLITGITESRKLVRDKAEELYQLSNEIKEKVHLLIMFEQKALMDPNYMQDKKYFVFDHIFELSSKIDQIEMIANLYLHKNVRDVNIYCLKTRECTSEIINASLDQKNLDQILKDVYSKLETAHYELKQSIALMVIERGQPNWL